MFFTILILIIILVYIIIALTGAEIVYLVLKLFIRKKERNRLAAIWSFIFILACLLSISGVFFYKVITSAERQPTESELRARKRGAEERQEKMDNIQPVTYEKALKIESILPALPASATNIYFYRDTPSFFTFTQLLRFEASLEDIERYVQEIINDYPSAWEKMPVANSKTSGNLRSFIRKETIWFDPTQIVNGTCYNYDYYKAKGAPTIYQYVCVDSDGAVLYWSQGD